MPTPVAVAAVTAVAVLAGARRLHGRIERQEPRLPGDLLHEEGEGLDLLRGGREGLDRRRAVAHIGIEAGDEAPRLVQLAPGGGGRLPHPRVALRAVVGPATQAGGEMDESLPVGGEVADGAGHRIGVLAHLDGARAHPRGGLARTGRTGLEQGGRASVLGGGGAQVAGEAPQRLEHPLEDPPLPVEAADDLLPQPPPQVAVGDGGGDLGHLGGARLEPREDHEQEDRRDDHRADAEEHGHQGRPFRPRREPPRHDRQLRQREDDQDETGVEEPADETAHA